MLFTSPVGGHNVMPDQCMHSHVIMTKPSPCKQRHLQIKTVLLILQTVLSGRMHSVCMCVGLFAQAAHHYY